VQELIKVNAFDEASQGIDEAVTAIEAAPQPEATSKFGTYGDIAAIANVRYLHLPIADALIEKNQRDAAAEQYKKASEALDMLPPEAAIVKSIGERHRILTLVKLDRIDDAIEVVEHLPKTGMNAKIATPIAVQLIKNGETDKALAFMESIPPMPIDNSERGEIAAALFDAHGVDRCLDYMASLDESEGAARAWQQLARVFAEQKRFDDLEKLYAAIDSKFGKAHVAIEVATRLQYPETKP
jgi:tetratricopeptide (TPR) repeat protein